MVGWLVYSNTVHMMYIYIYGHVGGIYLEQVLNKAYQKLCQIY